MDDKDEATVMMFALRYSYGRRTYAFSVVTGFILHNLDKLQPWHMKQMSEETREAAAMYSDLPEWEKQQYIAFAEKLLEEAENDA